MTAAVPEALATSWRGVLADAPAPAIAAAVVTPLGTVFEEVRGVANLLTGERATVKHRWDLASLTKPLLTTTAVLNLVAAGRLRLGTRVAEVLPAAEGTGFGQAPVGRLLSHGHSLPPDLPLFRDPDQQRVALLARILAVRPRPGAVYSDLNYIVLGEVVEAVAGRSLAAVAASLGYDTANPGDPGPHPGWIATEHCPWRGRLVQGEVHDENAAALGGIAGHAGCFATLPRVADAARGWLTGGGLPDGSRELATRCWAENGAERFGLGFFLGRSRSLGGSGAGARGFGASGFVGNRLWVEPEAEYAVVVLGNRVHPRRGDRAPFDHWCSRFMDSVRQGLAAPNH